MPTGTKKLESMRRNPKSDWTIDDLKSVARKFNVTFRQGATSHVVFSHPVAGKLTVPARKPIKPIYVREFVGLIDRVDEGE